MPVSPSYRNQTSELICCANQLTGFYTNATLAFNGLIKKIKENTAIIHVKVNHYKFFGMIAP